MELNNLFISQMSALLGNNDADIFIKALQEDSPTVSIRRNPWKYSDDTMPETLTGNISENVPWCKSGVYLKERPNFTLDPLLHSGAYYVQEAASMFIDHVVRQVVHYPVLALDLCAAPGGKSTALRAALPEGSMLFANEPMRQRANILAENVQKQGHPDMIVTNNFAPDYRKSSHMFDLIATDVPCSGEGMFRKDEGAVSQWTPRLTEECQALQREIVGEIWHCLKPEGILIYSTCTFNTLEDEENVKWIEEELGGEVIEIACEKEWNITGSLLKGYDRPVYRFMPGRTKGEGLFMAVIRKNSDTSESITEKLYEYSIATEGKKNKRNKGKNFSRIDGKNRGNERVNGKNITVSPDSIASWLKNKDDFSIITSKERITAIRTTWENTYNKAKDCLRILSAGIEMGTVKGKDIIPEEALALSIELNDDAFPRTELSLENALSYLRRETITLPDSTPKGFAVVTYKGQPLGFVKNLGNRANNLFPQEWRIRNL